MATKVEKDLLSGQETTGHEWDGVQELNTPLPKWWVYTFYACIAFAVVYGVLFPAIPLGGTYTKGVLGTSTRAELEQTLADNAKKQKPYLDKINAKSLAEIKADPDLVAYAVAGGKAIFADNCAPCHGSGGSGRPGGFPTLADDDWLWGGDLESIHQTIKFGIRNGHAEARDSQMPKFSDGLLTPAQIGDVADHVLSLSNPAAAKSAKGAEIFAEQCAACHGPEGKGMQEMGAPNLTDKIWLYGGDKIAIVKQISNPKMGVMPVWSGRLSPESIKMAAIYVHSLGGGK